VTVDFFDDSQVVTPVAAGVTWDTVSSNGYLFTYTRDKLSTGGIEPDPICTERAGKRRPARLKMSPQASTAGRYDTPSQRFAAPCRGSHRRGSRQVKYPRQGSNL
jgi:hypothetical protein